MWKNVHPVYSAGIQTHDLWNMSLFPYPLDQGSGPKNDEKFLKGLCQFRFCTDVKIYPLTVSRQHPTPEISSSNPAIGKFYFLSTVFN